MKKEIDEERMHLGFELIDREVHESKEEQDDDVRGEILSLSRNLDADGVTSYLIKLWKKKKKHHHHHSDSEQENTIRDALTSAPDPAKLVLDVCLGFNDDKGKKKQIDRKKEGCILLLEQLTKLGPTISPDVGEEAKGFASDWESHLRRVRCPLGTLGFLQFLAAFNLTSSYSAQQLLSLSKNFCCGLDVYRPDQTVDLCSSLGISEVLPALITSLIEGQKFIVAVKYICLFKLESHFSPEPLLQAHVARIKGRVEERCSRGTKKDKIAAFFMEWDAIRSVLKCIKYLKLESKFPVTHLETQLKQLENQKIQMNQNKAAAKLLRRKNLGCCTEQRAESSISANSQNKTAESSSHCQGEPVPTSPTGIQSDLQAGKKRSTNPNASLGHRGWQEKRPRVVSVHQVAPPGPSPWPQVPQPLSCSFGAPAHFAQNGCASWTPGPATASIGFPGASYGAPPHFGANQNVPGRTYPVYAPPFYNGSINQVWNRPRRMGDQIRGKLRWPNERYL